MLVTLINHIGLAQV